MGMTLRCFLSIFSMSFLLLGCSNRPIKELTKQNWLAPLEAKSWIKQNSEKPHSLMNSFFEGRDSLRFEIREGEAWEIEGIRTFRTEISTHEFPPMGAEKW